MNILSIEKTERQYVTQRLSDGSDRQEIVETAYTVKFEANDKVHVLEFDHDPTRQEIVDASGGAVESKDPADLILLLGQRLKEQSEITELLLQMQLEKEGIL